MKTKITFIFVFILSLSLSAQYYFAREYGQFKTGSSFIQTSDSGFVVLTGDNYLIKIDKTGELDWQREFSYFPAFFHEMDDSTIIVALNQNYANSKFAVCKLDKNGDLIFAKSYLISEGYPVFTYYGTFLRNDTLVAIVSENDSIIKAYNISSSNGDTINSVILINNSKRVSLSPQIHKNKYVNNEFFLYARWNQTGTSTPEGFYVIYRFSADLILIDSAKTNFSTSYLSDVNSSNKIINSCSGTSICLKFFEFPNENPYLDSSYTQPPNTHSLFKYFSSFNNNFLISGREADFNVDSFPKGLICKVDENGNILFRKHYIIDGYGVASFNYLNFGENYIFAVGSIQTNFGEPYNLFVVKTDLNGNVTSVPSHGLAANVRVYPNPATDILYVDMPKDAGGFAQYEIFDLQGSLLAKGRLHGNSIDVSGFLQGMYLLTIEIGGQRHSVKWVRE